MIKVDGSAPPPELEWKKPIALLIYMAHAERYQRPKDHVMGMLWPDARHPNRSLTQARYLLRRWGGATIAESHDQLRLDPASVELDTTELDRLAGAQRWPQAAALIEGEFLEGFSPSQTSGFTEWVTTERARWASKSAGVLIRWSEVLLGEGAPERAVIVAERARTLVPHSDPAMRAYLKCLGLLGRRTEAIEELDRFTHLLAVDLDTRPEPETTRLAGRIRSNGPSRTPGPVRRRGPLVGRAAQLKRVMDTWSSCLAGEATLALVLGDPGMGKTRFAEEVVERAREHDGAAVALTRVLPGDADQIWGGLVALAEGGLLEAPGIPAAPAAALAGLGARSSRWAERFPGRGSPEPLAPPRALVEVVRAAAAESPVLLVVDDAHWMDHESLQSLLTVARDLASLRVMVLITAHPDPARVELDRLRSRLDRDAKGTSVTLESLSHAELIALATWALPSYDPEQLDRIARRVHVDSGGLPLLAFELLTAVAEGLELGRVAQPWPPPKMTLHDAFPSDLPDSVLGAIRVSYRRLSTDAQAALAALAVLGDRAPAERVGRGAELGSPRLDVALDELEWQRWVTTDAKGYAFLARAIRDIVKEAILSEGQRRRILERVAIGAPG